MENINYVQEKLGKKMRESWAFGAKIFNIRFPMVYASGIAPWAIIIYVPPERNQLDRHQSQLQAKDLALNRNSKIL